MICLHPHCPRGQGAASWLDVVSHPAARIRATDRSRLLSALAACGPLSGRVALAPDLAATAPFARLLDLCPCLYAQIDVRVSARAVVHLCEVTLGTSINSANVHDAFLIQYPGQPPPFRFSPISPGASGGDIMEALCSEVLTNHGLPHMENGPDGWPKWTSKAHVTLNQGKLHPLKLYGDILIPAAPHNLLISVKSETARERFVISGNRLESIGFGFFNDPSEFWTTSRMNLLKRWGFSAIYMPTPTINAIRTHLVANGTENHAININGRPLYRDITRFGDEMAAVAGRLCISI